MVQVPTKLGRYEIVKHLANGGMAQVLIARATGIEGFERHVVVKRIHGDHVADPAFVQMFLDEARTAAALHHANIVQVHDIGKDNGEYFFAMEYVHGQDLRMVLKELNRRRDQMPWEHIVTIMTSAAAGLHHAHELRGPDRKLLGLVHRDVSPANILIGYDGNVKMVDFGIAKAALRTGEGTRGGALKGKVAYMAPEQCAGKQIDRRSDVYALGVVLYELSTVRRLFKCDNDFLTMSAIVAGDIPSPLRSRPDMPLQLVDIIHKALSKRPADRYQSADEFRLALEDLANDLRLRTSQGAMSSYMKHLFGTQPEPWLVDEDAEIELSVDFDGSASGMARASEEAEKDLEIPASIEATVSAPISHARRRITESPPLSTEVPMAVVPAGSAPMAKSASGTGAGEPRPKPPSVTIPTKGEPLVTRSARTPPTGVPSPVPARVASIPTKVGGGTGSVATIPGPPAQRVPTPPTGVSARPATAPGASATTTQRVPTPPAGVPTASIPRPASPGGSATTTQRVPTPPAGVPTGPTSSGAAASTTQRVPTPPVGVPTGPTSSGAAATTTQRVPTPPTGVSARSATAPGASATTTQRVPTPPVGVPTGPTSSGAAATTTQRVPTPPTGVSTARPATSPGAATGAPATPPRVPTPPTGVSTSSPPTGVSTSTEVAVPVGSPPASMMPRPGTPPLGVPRSITPLIHIDPTIPRTVTPAAGVSASGLATAGSQRVVTPVMGVPTAPIVPLTATADGSQGLTPIVDDSWDTSSAVLAMSTSTAPIASPPLASPPLASPSIAIARTMTPPAIPTRRTPPSMPVVQPPIATAPDASPSPVVEAPPPIVAAPDAAVGLLTLTDEDLLEDAFPSGPHSIAPATAIAPFALPPRAVSERRIVPRRNLTPLILGGVGVVLLIIVIAVAARGSGGDKPEPPKAVVDPPSQPLAEPSPDAAVAEPDAAVLAGSAHAGSGSAKKPVVVPPKKRPVVPPPQPPKKKWNPDELFLKKKVR